ncbi:MAG: MoxR family ATPase, partial [Candidatus Cloacimonas sp.]|nr:MoxR family ATPase [Candidatus Cloacimonadota bacterium]
MNIDELNLRIREKSGIIENVQTEVRKVIIGQDYMIRRILVGLLANGHLLLEGVPGLAKTLAVNTIANTFNATFKRIQFTP